MTLSGSLPRGVDAGYYAELVKIAEEAGAKVLLDTSVHRWRQRWSPMPSPSS